LSGYWDELQVNPAENARPPSTMFPWNTANTRTPTNNKVETFSGTRTFKSRRIPDCANPTHMHNVQFSLEVESKVNHYPLFNWFSVGACLAGMVVQEGPDKKCRIKKRPWISRCSIYHPSFKRGTLVMVQALESCCNNPILGAVICNMEELKEFGPNGMRTAFRVMKHTSEADHEFLKDIQMDPMQPYDEELLEEHYLTWLQTTRRIYDPRRGLSIIAEEKFWSMDNTSLKIEQEQYPDCGQFVKPGEHDEHFALWYQMHQNGEDGKVVFSVPAEDKGGAEFKEAVVKNVLSSMTCIEERREHKKTVAEQRQQQELEAKAKADQEEAAKKAARVAALEAKEKERKSAPAVDKQGKNANGAQNKQSTPTVSKPPIATRQATSVNKANNRKAAEVIDLVGEETPKNKKARGGSATPRVGVSSDNHDSDYPAIPDYTPVASPSLPPPVPHQVAAITKNTSTTQQSVSITPQTPDIERMLQSFGYSLQSEALSWVETDKVTPDDYQNSPYLQEMFKRFETNMKLKIIEKWRKTHIIIVRSDSANDRSLLEIRSKPAPIPSPTPPVNSIPERAPIDWQKTSLMVYLRNQNGEIEDLKNKGFDFFLSILARFQEQNPQFKVYKREGALVIDVDQKPQEAVQNPNLQQSPRVSETTQRMEGQQQCRYPDHREVRNNAHYASPPVYGYKFGHNDCRAVYHQEPSRPSQYLSPPSWSAAQDNAYYHQVRRDYYPDERDLQQHQNYYPCCNHMDCPRTYCLYERPNNWH
jgi:hypothetical protein